MRRVRQMTEATSGRWPSKASAGQGADGQKDRPEETRTILGTCHIPEIPTIMTTSGLEIHVLTPDPVSDPEILGMLASGQGTLSMMGDY